MSNTPIYELGLWAGPQAQPWVQHDAALRLIEALIRGSVADDDLSAPPGSCADGAAYLVKATATGAWAGHDGEMAVAVGTNAANGWLFAAVAIEGALLWVDDEDTLFQYDGAAWAPFSGGGGAPTESIIIACSDETTALTTGTAKVTLRMPYAFTVTGVRASLTTAQASGSIFTVDINEGGASILSTKLTIDNTEKTSTTAATAAVISDSALADDAEITIDIDQVGDGTAKGLKVVLIGHR